MIFNEFFTKPLFSPNPNTYGVMYNVYITPDEIMGAVRVTKFVFLFGAINGV